MSCWSRTPLRRFAGLLHELRPTRQSALCVARRSCPHRCRVDGQAAILRWTEAKAPGRATDAPRFGMRVMEKVRSPLKGEIHFMVAEGRCEITMSIREEQRPSWRAAIG